MIRGIRFNLSKYLFLFHDVDPFVFYVKIGKGEKLFFQCERNVRFLLDYRKEATSFEEFRIAENRIKCLRVAVGKTLP